MIREARPEDVEAITDLTASLFPRLKNKNISFDKISFAAYAHGFAAGSQISKAFVSEKDGELASFIFVILLMQPLSGELIAMKSLWETKIPGHGRSVLRAAEKWAKERGARRMIVGCFETQTERLLSALGYSEFEKSFEKELT